MTIRIYPGQLPSKPIENHKWDGLISDWFDAAGIEYKDHEIQPITVRVNDVLIHSSEWDKTTVSNEDVVDINPVPRGGIIKAVTNIISKVFGFIFGQRGAPKTNQQVQGENLSTSNASANTAKLNAVVPELIGRYIRYPDYLNQPVRYFSDPRTQYLDMLLCIGPGDYEIESVNIGNTPIDSLSGAEYAIHKPGDGLSSYDQRVNWYNSPEVGSTSGGTAGLELSSIPDSNVNPTANNYHVNGNVISIIAPSTESFPDSWGVGVSLGLVIKQTVVVDLEIVDGVNSNTFSGNFTEINPQVGAVLRTIGGVIPESVMISKVVDGKMVLSTNSTESSIVISDIIPGTYSIGFSRAGRTYSIQSSSEKSITITANDAIAGGANFFERDFTLSDSEWSVNTDTVYGEVAGPFYFCPASEKSNTFEVDFFFPQGLAYVKDDGSILERSVGIEIGYRLNESSSWVITNKWYRNATMDQIGYTERITTPTKDKYQVRIRRRGAKSTSTNVRDEVQWYGLRSVLDYPDSYANWTTMTVRIKGLGQIASNSENQVNIVATRKLPVLQSNGTWSEPVATNQITSAVKYIAQTVGYDDTNMDIDSFIAMQSGTWTPRGEVINFVFDETVAKSAIDVCLAAGMAEQTIEDGVLTPVREGIRTAYEQSYSGQNTLDGITRIFSAVRPDDNDGVEVEYSDENDLWATKTLVCLPPNSQGIKLFKLKLDGVTNKTNAWRIGMREALRAYYTRWNYEFTSELDALISRYGGYVALSYDMPGLSQSAIVLGIEKNGAKSIIHSSEILEFTSGKTHYFAIRRDDGSVFGPHVATMIDDFTISAGNVSLSEFSNFSANKEPYHLLFGPADTFVLPSLIASISPDGSQSVKVTAKNYDARIYANDNGTAPI